MILLLNCAYGFKQHYARSIINIKSKVSTIIYFPTPAFIEKPVLVQHKEGGIHHA
jgi:hypothetical protein